MVQFYPWFGRYNVLLAKPGKGMSFSVKQAFVTTDEIRAPLKAPA